MTSTRDELHSALSKIAIRPGGYAYLGKGDGSGTIVADFSKRLLYYYTPSRPWATAPLVTSENILAYNKSVLENTRVRLGYPSEQPSVLHILGLDTGEGYDAVGGITPGEQLISAQKFTDTGSLINFRIAPNDPADTEVYINPGWYINTSGDPAFWNGDSTDTLLTTAIAALSSGEHQMAVVFVNAATGAAAIATNTAESGGVNDKELFDTTTIEDMTIADNYVPCGAVHLYDGQTSITENDIYRSSDPRIVFNRTGSGGGDTLPVTDTTAIVKGSADATKLLRFEVDGFTTATTRVLTPPNFDGTIATLAGTETFTNKTLTSPKINQILDSNGNEEIIFTATASAVNELTIANAASGGAPKIEATGANTNIGIHIAAKGDEEIRLTGRALIDGTDDQITLRVQATAAQTALLAVFEDSAGNDQVTISPNGAVVINEEGNDVDLRVESDTNANALVFDGSDTGGLGVGASPGSLAFQVTSTTKASYPAPGMTTAQRNALTPAAGWMIFNTSLTRYEIYNGSNWFPLASTFAILIDSKATTTAGGTSSSATWNARDLNTEQYDPNGLVTISSNKFVPIAGGYHARIYTPFAGGSAALSRSRTRLFNVTGAASVEEGMGVFAAANNGGWTMLDCTFTANGTDEYRVDTYTSIGRATDGLGFAVSDGSAETYTVVVLEYIG
jgi:hypothetical protein